MCAAEINMPTIWLGNNQANHWATAAPKRKRCKVQHFLSKCKENTSTCLVGDVVRFLKTPTFFFCWSTVLILPRWGSAKVKLPQGFSFLQTSLSSLLALSHKTSDYSISIFGCTNSCIGTKLLQSLAFHASSDKHCWALWNSINPAKSFPQSESTISHVCCIWHAQHAKQQGLLIRNWCSDKLTLLLLNKCLPLSNHSMNKCSSWKWDEKRMVWLFSYWAIFK